MTFTEKLDSLMERYGLNKRSLSLKSGIPYTTIDGWYKKGCDNLKLSTLKKLNAFFNTSLDFWVIDSITDPNYGRSFGFKISNSEMPLVENFRLLDSTDQARIMERIETMLETDKYKGKDASGGKAG